MINKRNARYFFSPLYAPLSAAAYFLAALVCVPLAFVSGEGAGGGAALLLLFLLTLPWSVVVFYLFAWPLFHGAAPGFFAAVFLLPVVVNGCALCAAMHYACGALRRHYEYYRVG